MFYIIGLGLCDEKDITVRGLEAVKSCTRVYLEAYTSILMVQKERLEAFYDKELILADRELVETGADELLRDADTEDVAFLVVGDPLGATTHTDILLRARALRIPTRVIHNASILNAVGACGLQLYNFGQAVSLVFFTESWRPDSFYDRVRENAGLGCHTLLLLDIKVKEQSEANMARGRRVYEPPRYMSIPTAVRQLVETEQARGEGVLDPATTLAIAVSRVGGIPRAGSSPAPPAAASASTTRTATDADADSDSDSPDVAPDTFVGGVDDARGQTLVAGTLAELLAQPREAFGPPLHSLVLVGRRLHVLEAEYAAAFAVDEKSWREVAQRVYGCVFD